MTALISFIKNISVTNSTISFIFYLSMFIIIIIIVIIKKYR